MSERITKKEEAKLRKHCRIYERALSFIRAGLFPPAMPQFMDACDRDELLSRIKRAYDEANTALKKVSSDT